MRLVARFAALSLVVACSTPAPTPSPTPSAAPTPAPSAAPTSAPTPTPSPAADVFDTSLPPDVVERLDNVLAGYAQDDSFVSISATVLVPAVGYWQSAAGLADRENDVPATPDTAYSIDGVSQTYVAALILRLAEEGFLNLDDPAADHLGPLAGSKSNGATVRELLGQRSGIDSYLAHVDYDRAWTLEELLDLVGDPIMQAGGPPEGSSTNYLLLGLIAEVVTGGPLGELLHEYLLDRFDLTRTYYTLTEAADDPVAHDYELGDGQFVDGYDGSGHLPSENAVSALRGAGAMASTAPDLARWMSLLCGGEVLGADAQAQMFDFHMELTEGTGLGIYSHHDASVGQIIGKAGSTLGSAALAYCDEDTGTVVVVLWTGEFIDPLPLVERFFAAASHALD